VDGGRACNLDAISNEEAMTWDDFLDEEFPLGDGVADTAARVRCPYCWKRAEIALDPGSGEYQEYVEDCPVCCRPWRVRVTYAADGAAEVEVEAADGE
jgi:hypothetical protein